jgi:hypothetical protein
MFIGQLWLSNHVVKNDENHDVLKSSKNRIFVR